MPLESFTGTAVDALLVRVRQTLGPEAEVVSVRTHRAADGRSRFEVLAVAAGDAAEERRRMGPDGGSHPLLRAAPRAGDFARRREGPRVLALVGPTGVGKTTTIAKLATHPEYFRNQRVGLLSLDTYRVGAVEQIRTYAEIAGLPLQVVYESPDIQLALQKLADRDLILVDTPGRGPRHHDDTQQIRQWLLQISPSETHLVLPTGLQPFVVRRAIQAYGDHGITHLMASKMDEAPDDWTLFDAAAEARLPMRWMSDGQEVPRDLHTAAPRLLTAIATLRLRDAQPAEVPA